MAGITKDTVLAIGNKIRRSDKTCSKHPKCHLVYLDGVTKIKPFCPACVQQGNIKQQEQMLSNLKEKETRGYLKGQSLVDRNEVFTYTFDNFKTKDNSPEAVLKEKARLIAGLYLKQPDQKSNSLLYGNAGAGKTHLAMAMLNAVNDNADPMVRCLFISVNKLIREMKNWFNDKASLWSPKHVTDVVSKANLVVLDDLGAESATGTATSFVQDTIFDIYESNQRIITTTNLSMNELYSTYHSRLVSRMQEGYGGKVIDFTKVRDKRPLIGGANGSSDRLG